jgi:hypothetical protein
MTLPELKKALRLKTEELEVALQAGTPHAHVVKIYKELKELQYRIIQEELNPEQAAH